MGWSQVHRRDAEGAEKIQEHFVVTLRVSLSRCVVQRDKNRADLQRCGNCDILAGVRRGPLAQLAEQMTLESRSPL